MNFQGLHCTCGSGFTREGGGTGCRKSSGSPVLFQCSNQHRHFLALLHGHFQRAARQRAGWRQPQPLSQALMGIVQQVQGRAQIARRGVVAVDQAQ